MPLVPLSPSSREFGRSERLLQVHLNAPQLKISEAIDITNSNCSVQYEKFCQSLARPNIVTVFVPFQRFPQTIADISAVGLKINPVSGLHVTLGSFLVDRSAEIIEVLQLRIALGTPQNHQSLDLTKNSECSFIETPPKRADLKPNFHSICTSSAGDYYIFSRSQVECVSFIRFDGGENVAEHTVEDTLCDVCRTEEATIWCVNCSAKLCAACDSASHAVNPVLARHERMPLVDARALRELCPEHPKYHYEFYCRTCRTSLCTQCKMTGSHSRGEAAEHELSPIREVYSEAVAALETTDPTIAERRAVILAKKAELDGMFDEVITNLGQLEIEIEKIVEEGIEQERGVAGEKALVIRSVQTELQRKLKEVEGLEQSLQVHRRQSGPQAFLKAAQSQERIVGRWQSNSDLPLEVITQGDMVVHGSGLLDLVLVKSRRSRSRSRDGEKSSFEGTEKEVIELNRWIRSILPEFIDLRMEFETGLPLITLLRVIQPDRRPSLPYSGTPSTPEECQEARVAAVHFAKELGIKGNYDESILVVGGDDPSELIALLRTIQRELAGVGRETSAGVSPRRDLKVLAGGEKEEPV
jgi:hypothetical protein